MYKVPGRKFAASATERQVWTAQLRPRDADILDDPEWECEHTHFERDEALDCAKTEAGRRYYRSRYAKTVFHAGLDAETVGALTALDEVFWETQEQLDDAMGHDVTVMICVRLLNAYRQGLSGCPLDHVPEDNRNT